MAEMASEAIDAPALAAAFGRALELVKPARRAPLYWTLA